LIIGALAVFAMAIINNITGILDRAIGLPGGFQTALSRGYQY